MKDLFKRLVRVARLTPTTAAQRFSYACGALLLLSGTFHGVVQLVAGGPWDGPVSWRKPTVFGLSFGITLVTLAWFMTFIRPRKAVAWALLGVFAVASLGEVFLVSMQKWRGVASHFNQTTPFDEQVFSLMGALVALVALVTIFVTALAFFPLDAPPSLAWAIRAGLVLMLVSQAVGVQMIAEGGNTFGAAGALKVPHFVTLHAVQVLPALALLSALSHSTEAARLRIVGFGAAGYAALIASTMVQAYDGRGPLDLGVITSLMALAGLALLATGALIVLRGLRSVATTPRMQEARP